MSDNRIVIPNNTYLIRNRKSGLVLGVQNASKDKGAHLVQWKENGSLDQLWAFENAEGGGMNILNIGSQLYVGVQNASKEKGAQLVVWFYNESPDQVWRPFDLGGGIDRIVNANSGMVMGVQNASTDPGANIVQWPYNGSADQKWQLIPATAEQLQGLDGMAGIAWGAREEAANHPARTM